MSIRLTTLFLCLFLTALVKAADPDGVVPKSNQPLTGSAWVLSIGINNYQSNFIAGRNCESDARLFAEFFKRQFDKKKGKDSLKRVNTFLLTGAQATRQAILSILTTIVDSSKPDDYFIFNFAGYCNVFHLKNRQQTFFAPSGMRSIDSAGMITEGISLQQLNSFFTLIPANKQLFFTEAGPTPDFRKEFIQTIVEKNPVAASFSQKNRIVMVTNEMGIDQLICSNRRVVQGPMNYYLTKLPDSLNVYDIFAQKKIAAGIAYAIKKNEVICGDYKSPYFDIYFERDFLENFQLLAGNEGATRGGRQSPKTAPIAVNEGKPGRKVALIIASNQYNHREEWPILKTAINDAKAVGDTLKNQYGYTVDYVLDGDKAAITQRIVALSKDIREEDQLIVYFAGHGDYNEELLDDGFIVCKDSKPTDQDPTRESYLSFNNMSRIINRMPARQVLVLLDVCFGGTFADKVVKSTAADRPADFTQKESFESKKLKLRTRKFISSGGKNKVPDQDMDPQFSNHSPFAVLLLEALRTKGRNNYLTALQVYSIMQDRLSSNPSLGDFGEIERDSDYLLIARRDN